MGRAVSDLVNNSDVIKQCGVEIAGHLIIPHQMLIWYKALPVAIEEEEEEEDIEESWFSRSFFGQLRFSRFPTSHIRECIGEFPFE